MVVRPAEALLHLRLALALMVSLFLVSAVPDDPGDPVNLGRRILFVSPGVQSLLHVPVFALLAWLLWRAFTFAGRAPVPAALSAAGIATLYGIFDEVHQLLVPGRHASITDLLLDAAGAALVVLIALRRR